MSKGLYTDVFQDNNNISDINIPKNITIKEDIYKKPKTNWYKKQKIIKQKMVKWLMTDMGDNMILLDFLLISFEELISNLNFTEYKTTRKKFFTRYVNWIYKYTIRE